MVKAHFEFVDSVSISLILLSGLKGGLGVVVVVGFEVVVDVLCCRGLTVVVGDGFGVINSIPTEVSSQPSGQ